MRSCAIASRASLSAARGRMLVPMPFALSVLWDWGREVGTRADGRRDNMPKFEGSELEIFLGHLWFLYYLLWLSLAAVAVVLVARRVRARAAGARRCRLVTDGGRAALLRALHTDTPLGLRPRPTDPRSTWGRSSPGAGSCTRARRARALHARRAWPGSRCAPRWLLVIVIVTLARGSTAVAASDLREPSRAACSRSRASSACSARAGRYLARRPRPAAAPASRASYWSATSCTCRSRCCSRSCSCNAPLPGPLKYLVILAATTRDLRWDLRAVSATRARASCAARGRVAEPSAPR